MRVRPFKFKALPIIIVDNQIMFSKPSVWWGRNQTEFPHHGPRSWFRRREYRCQTWLSWLKVYLNDKFTKYVRLRFGKCTNILTYWSIGGNADFSRLFQKKTMGFSLLPCSPLPRFPIFFFQNLPSHAPPPRSLTLIKQHWGGGVFGKSFCVWGGGGPRKSPC